MVLGCDVLPSEPGRRNRLFHPRSEKGWGDELGKTAGLAPPLLDNGTYVGEHVTLPMSLQVNGLRGSVAVWRRVPMAVRRRLQLRTLTAFLDCVDALVSGVGAIISGSGGYGETGPGVVYQSNKTHRLTDNLA